MEKLSDLNIIHSVLRGNDADFSLLIDRYKDKAYSLLLRMLKNEMDAEEVLQDSFLKAYNALEKFKEQAKFSTWFYKIVYNTALSFIASKRKRQDDETSSIDDFHYLKSEEIEIYAETEDANHYIHKLVNKLPVKNGIILILFYIDGLSLSEISEIMNLSLVNTKVTLHRSRNALRDLILKHNYQEELL